MIYARLCLVCGVTLASGKAFAHAGHGAAAWQGSVLHYWFEPVHLPLSLALGTAVLLAARWVWRRRRSGRGSAALRTGGRAGPACRG